jgi:hypothetical protein
MLLIVQPARLWQRLWMNLKWREIPKCRLNMWTIRFRLNLNSLNQM